MYAIKNWGWKAVREHHVETWTFTPHDIQVIARGIGDILDQEGHYDNDHDDEIDLYVYVYTSKKNFTVSLKELEHGQIISKQSKSTDIDVVNNSLANAAKPVYKPVSGIKGSEKMIAGIPAAEYRRKFKNNYGESKN